MGIEQMLGWLQSRPGFSFLPRRRRRKFASQRAISEPLERRNLLSANSFSVAHQAFDVTSPLETQDSVIFAVNSPENTVNLSAGRNDSLSAGVSSQTDVATELQPEFNTHAEGLIFEGIRPTSEASSLVTYSGPHSATSVLYETAIPETTIAVWNSGVQFGQLVGTQEFSVPESGILSEQNIQNIELISQGQVTSYFVFSMTAGTRVFIDVADGFEIVDRVPGNRIDGNNRSPVPSSRHVISADTAKNTGQHLSVNVSPAELSSNAKTATTCVSPLAWQLTAGKTTTCWHNDTNADTDLWGQTRPLIVTGHVWLAPKTNKSYSPRTRQTSATYWHAFRDSSLSATKLRELESQSTAHRFLAVHLGDPIGRLSALSCSNLLGEFSVAGGSSNVADSWLSGALATVSHPSSKAAFTVSVLGVAAWVALWPGARQIRSDRRTAMNSSRILDDTVRAVRLTY